MSDDVMFDQQAVAKNVIGQSPLHHLGGTFKSEGVQLEEVPFLGYLTLRGDSGDESFLVGVKEALGTELPVKPLTLAQGDALSIQWISPDEWMIVCPGERCFELESALRNHLTGHFSVVNVSGGYTLITLSGDWALDVLYQSTAYDVHPRHFKTGMAVATTLSKATMLLRKPSDEHWELVVRRSFADYCWRWLVGAC